MKDYHRVILDILEEHDAPLTYVFDNGEDYDSHTLHVVTTTFSEQWLLELVNLIRPLWRHEGTYYDLDDRDEPTDHDLSWVIGYAHMGTVLSWFDQGGMDEATKREQQAVLRGCVGAVDFALDHARKVAQGSQGTNPAVVEQQAERIPRLEAKRKAILERIEKLP